MFCGAQIILTPNEINEIDMDDGGGDAPDASAATAQLEELRKQLHARQELRTQNAQDVVVSLRAQIASGAVKLKADIKKSGAFVKKLKMLTENNAESVLKDVMELNLTRYVSECVAAIAEAPLKVADLSAAVRVASLLHQRYDEFTAALVPTLVATFDASFGADDKTKIVRRRMLLRLLAELLLAGVYDDATVIVALVQRVVRREGGAVTRPSAAAARLKATTASSTPAAAQLEVPLLVSFAKSMGLEFLGIRPRKLQSLEVALGATFTAVITHIQALVPQSAQSDLRTAFADAFERVSRLYVAQHVAVGKLALRNEREDANRGDIADAHVLEFERATLLFDKLQTSVNALADALDRDVPALPSNRTDALDGAGLQLYEADGSARALRSDCPFDDEDTRAFYEDLPDLLVLVPAVVLGLSEAEVVELKKKREAGGSAAADAVEEAEAEAAADELEHEVGDTTDGDIDAHDAAEHETEASDQHPTDGATSPDATPAASSSSSSSTTPAVVSYHHQHDAFFASLEDLVNRDRCDNAAVDFCYRNSKANRHRLIKTLFQVPRTHLELLPYYARLIATLQSVLKDDVAHDLVDQLVSEFSHHLKKRNQFRLESKIKNIRFIGELVKFRMCPPATAFRCLKKCFADFQGHNVLVATTLLETCGRFLYCAKHSHARTAACLTILMKLKAAKHLDPQAETLVQNAYYMCKPPERVARVLKTYDPLYRFVLKCLYTDLTDASVNKVIKTLRKLPWQSSHQFIEDDSSDNATTAAMVLRAVRKVTRGKVMHMKLVCDVVKGLARYHDELPVLLVDDVLEHIRRSLAVNDYREHQRSLGVVKLLGELHNCALVNGNVVIETLYALLHHSHDLLSLPEYASIHASTIANTQAPTATATATGLDALQRRWSLVPDMRFDPRVPSDVDGPTDVFRIRLVCALIETCTSAALSPATAASGSGSGSSDHRGLSRPRLSRFLVFFQRYMLSKIDVPLETDFVVDDLLEMLSRTLFKDQPFERYATWIEADAAVQRILRTELDDAERLVAKKHAAIVAAAAEEKTRGSVDGADAAAVGNVSLARAGDDDDEEDENEEDDRDEDDDDEEDGESDSDDDDDDASRLGKSDGHDDEEDDDDDGSSSGSSSSDSDDDDESGSDDDGEDDDEQLIIHDRVQTTEEDDAFEKAFKSMMQSAADPRTTLAGHRVNVDKMAIPTVVKVAAGPSSSATNDPTTESTSGATTPVNGPPGVVFRMLRRGNKGKVEARQIVVPEESSLAQHSHRQEHVGKRELSELKRLVLQNIERDDFDSEVGDAGPAFALAPRASSSSSSTSNSNINHAAAQAQATTPAPRDLNRTGYGLSSEWNNDEFGLRRGRNYRGQK